MLPAGRARDRSRSGTPRHGDGDI